MFFSPVVEMIVTVVCHYNAIRSPHACSTTDSRSRPAASRRFKADSTILPDRLYPPCFSLCIRRHGCPGAPRTASFDLVLRRSLIALPASRAGPTRSSGTVIASVAGRTAIAPPLVIVSCLALQFPAFECRLPTQGVLGDTGNPSYPTDSIQALPLEAAPPSTCPFQPPHIGQARPSL